MLAEGAVGIPEGAATTTQAEFEQAWRIALRHRHFSRYDTGPLPMGTRVTGTVTALPWGPGRTGLFVDIGSVAEGFVDLLELPRDSEDWPQLGDVLSWEVTTIRVDLHSLYGRTNIQVRLRPVHDV